MPFCGSCGEVRSPLSRTQRAAAMPMNRYTWRNCLNRFFQSHCVRLRHLLLYQLGTALRCHGAEHNERIMSRTSERTANFGSYLLSRLTVHYLFEYHRRLCFEFGKKSFEIFRFLHDLLMRVVSLAVGFHVKLACSLAQIPN